MTWSDPENWHWKTGRVDPGRAVIFDIDGVLADASGRQHLLEWPRRDWDAFFAACGDDALIGEVARTAELMNPDLSVVLLTARPHWVQPHTLGWIEDHGLRWDLLIMRDWGDYMAAPNFKRLSTRELRDYGFELELALDDDPRNVAMFESEGVPCVYIHSGYHA